MPLVPRSQKIEIAYAEAIAHDVAANATALILVPATIITVPAGTKRWMLRWNFPYVRHSNTSVGTAQVLTGVVDTADPTATGIVASHTLVKHAANTPDGEPDHGEKRMPAQAATKSYQLFIYSGQAGTLSILAGAFIQATALE